MDNKEHGSAKTTHVYAEELYYDLARAARLESTVFDTAKAVTPMKFALQNTVWDIGTIEINSAKSFESTEEIRSHYCSLSQIFIMGNWSLIPSGKPSVF